MDVFPLGHLGIAAALALALGWPAEGDGSARRRPDLRFIALGALLPDIIDKPLGHIVLAQQLDNGRLVCHTLAFLTIVAALGILRDDARWKAVAFGVATHLGLDMMWSEPRTLLWPLYGFGFSPEDFHGSHWLNLLVSDPYTLGGELVGGALLLTVLFGTGLHRPGALKRYLREGPENSSTH